MVHGILTACLFLLLQLQLIDPSVHARAAQYLFERAHTSHPRSGRNKVQMGLQGAIKPLCSLLLSPSEDARYQACSALSEIAFCNEDNGREIISTDGCLQAIAMLLHPEHGDLQCDAALIINNCAAFCPDTCLPIIQYGILEPLQRLAVEENIQCKNVAVGALNSLSRCFATRPAMLDAGVVERTLSCVLDEQGQGDQYEARMARAAMAVANLSGHEHSILFVGSNVRAALSSICKIMRYSLEDKSWAGIYFSPYSVCLPLYNLSLNVENRKQLVEFGMIQLISELLITWKPGHLSDETLSLALNMARQLTLHPDDDTQRIAARTNGLVQSIQMVQKGTRGESWRCQEAAASILSELSRRHTAIWMCQHHRLGASSCLHWLDDSITDMIVGFACV